MAYLCWPTIAPSSVAYYPANGPIPGWGNSLLVTSLKNGALYRVPLNADGKTAQGDVAKYFHTPNRYRSALVSPDGKTIYVATDVRGNALGIGILNWNTKTPAQPWLCGRIFYSTT